MLLLDVMAGNSPGDMYTSPAPAGESFLGYAHRTPVGATIIVMRAAAGG